MTKREREDQPQEREAKRIKGNDFKGYRARSGFLSEKLGVNQDLLTVVMGYVPSRGEESSEQFRSVMGSFKNLRKVSLENLEELKLRNLEKINSSHEKELFFEFIADCKKLKFLSVPEWFEGKDIEMMLNRIFSKLNKERIDIIQQALNNFVYVKTILDAQGDFSNLNQETIKFISENPNLVDSIKHNKTLYQTILNNQPFLRELLIDLGFKVEKSNDFEGQSPTPQITPGDFGKLFTSSLKTLQLFNSKDFGDQSLKKILERYPYLENLCLIGCKELTILPNNLSPDLKILNLRDCIGLDWNQTSEIFPVLNKLELLDLSGIIDLTEEGLKKILLKCPNIKELKLFKCYELDFSQLSEDFPILNQLEVIDCSTMLSLTGEGLKNILSKCPNVKELKLFGCDGVDQIDLSDLSDFLSLEYIDFSHAELLVIDGLKNLLEKCPNIKDLNISGCESLQLDQLQDFPDLNELEKLDLSGNLRLTENGLKNLLEKCPNIKDLNISYCDSLQLDQLQDFPDLNKLEVLDLSGIQDLNANGLENILKKCPNLKQLNISSCESLVIGELHNFPDLNKLEVLDLSDSVSRITLGDLSNILGKCPNLKKLDLSNCDSLCLNIPEDITIPQMNELEEIDFYYSAVLLNDLNKILSQFPNLKSIDCNYCPGLEAIGYLPDSLTSLSVGYCEKLESISFLPDNIKVLDVSNCDKLTSLPEKLPDGLIELYLNGNLSGSFDILPQGLKVLAFGGDVELKKLENIPLGLELLEIDSCKKLSDISYISKLTNLKELKISECDSLECLIDSFPPSLNIMEIDNCPNLSKLVDHLPPYLKELRIYSGILKELPSNFPKGLKVLDITNCDELEKLPDDLPEGLTIIGREDLQTARTQRLENESAMIDDEGSEMPGTEPNNPSSEQMQESQIEHINQ